MDRGRGKELRRGKKKKKKKSRDGSWRNLLDSLLQRVKGERIVLKVGGSLGHFYSKAFAVAFTAFAASAPGRARSSSGTDVASKLAKPNQLAGKTGKLTLTHNLTSGH